MVQLFVLFCQVAVRNRTTLLTFDLVLLAILFVHVRIYSLITIKHSREDCAKNGFRLLNDVHFG